jgi:hypothetical protein
MQIISSYQLHKGVKVDPTNTLMSTIPSLIQPLQMLSYEHKDDSWRAWCMDWYEWQGIKQIRYKIEKLAKNYRLANGKIDKSDYIIAEEDENKDLIDALSRDNEINAVTELKFFPIIPNVVDLLVGEFSKRNNKVFAYAIDDYSKSEKLDKKKELIDQTLISQAQFELSQNLLQMGADPESEEFQQQVSQESIMSLPEIERFIKKDYRTSVEQWSNHQINSDKLRYRIDELEVLGFRDSLITDTEFWHIRLGENDYTPELWNPLYTFYHKSPNKRYISESNFAGFIELLTVADVIDMYGYMMSEDEITSLEKIYPSTNAAYLLSGENSGFYYDPTKSVQENQRGGSLGYRQYMAWEKAFGTQSYNSLFDWVLGEDENSLLTRHMLRVTTCYWRSQRKVYHLTKIDELGNITDKIVSEDFVVTEKPYYDNTFYKENTKDNLLYGEHLDCIWIPEIWGGIKIGPNLTTLGFQSNPQGMQPIYLGIGSHKKPDRLPFQFRGHETLYGARLPVEGAKFSERNSMSMSLVDRMKPFQVAYNIVNNQIQDILIDEIGTVIPLDQNTLPQRSMGEDWGKNNLAKAYVAAKNFQILPMDFSLENVEGPARFNQMTVLDMSQTQRLLGRIQLSNYFRQEAYLSIGVTQERMGTVNSQQTATGTQQAVNNSYAQTEKYFTQHSDWLMPRVYELMINAAQFYNSENPSIDLSYRTEKGEEVMFHMEQTDLLPRMINVHCTTSFQARDLKQKLEQLALTNNTMGASIYDLGKVIQADTPSEIIDAMEEVKNRMMQEQEAQRQHELELEKQMLDAQAAKDQRDKDFEAVENDLDRRARIIEKQIQAGGYGAMQDTNQNQNSDYLDALKLIQSQKEYQEIMNLDRQKENNKVQIERDKMQLKREEIAARERIADKANATAIKNKVVGEKKKAK